jgi:CheY-like chemotaxis protein/two-component sensor histidine kinase
VLSNLAVVEEALTRTQRQTPAQTVPLLLIDLADTTAAVRDAREGAERVRTIVRDLKAFSRGDEDERQVIDPAEPLRAAIQMAAHEIRLRARLELETGPLPLVEANLVRLSQVFLNLLLNAAQAVPEGAPGRHLVRVVTRTAADGWAELEVSDTGPGIPPQNLSRIFDPFFTTKPVGIGTGLGLSICQGIVSRVGGSIEVESPPGSGATFRVRLPPARGAGRDAAAPERPCAVAARATRASRILVVDDEPLVQAAMRRVLGAKHEVVSATEGRAALERLGAGGRFDAIICDLAMPGMDGIDFHAELSSRHPELRTRILFVTGGARTDRARAFVEALGDRVLEKPVDPDRLRRAVDAILAG